MESLANKIDEFRYIFKDTGTDIICVSETWLSSSIPNGLINLRGYSVFRYDRESRGGGVAIFMRNTLKAKFRTKSTRDERIEYVFVELVSTSRKILVGCCYRPNNTISMDQFQINLGSITLGYEDVIITGDFNSNILVNSTLTDNTLAIGLYTPNNTNPTHFSSSSNTLLDLFFVNNLSDVLLYDQISAPCFSKHDLIFLSYNLELQKDQIEYTISVDQQFDFLRNAICDLYNATVPIKRIKVKSGTKPWFNDTIKTAIRERDIAYSRWKRFRLPHLLEEYRSARRIANRNINAAKTEYYSIRFNSALDSREKWRIIHDIGVGKSRSSGGYQGDPNDLNEMFTNIPAPPTDTSFYDTDDGIGGILSERNDFEFSTYPTIWKHAKIIPIPKSNSESRPIAILCYVSKVFEKILHKQIYDYLLRGNLLSERQSGFRRDHSCTVYTRDTYSLPLPVTKGVPQGSIIGPLLFCMYANDLPLEIVHSQILMYADDIQIFLSSPVGDTSECLGKLNHDLDRVFRWATANGLLLNPQKSKCLIIQKNRRFSLSNADIMLNG
ncbi:uncharacterized protein LOC142232810 [Haematobia irritans]|uniref:uncharacterized protein LOC142232810 n=1 Tax=Haematobia irritans TaxID=7368 RepID=UPI003F5062EB